MNFGPLLLKAKGLPLCEQRKNWLQPLLLLVADLADCSTAWMSASLRGFALLEATPVECGPTFHRRRCVLLGSVISTLFAGVLADWMGASL